MFVGHGRWAEALLTLTYDRYLQPKPDSTVIYVADIDTAKDWQEQFLRLGISTADKDIHADITLAKNTTAWPRLWEVNGWLAQQMLKLLALDQHTEQRVLIQDCDTWCISPYQWWDSRPRIMTVAAHPSPPAYRPYTTRLLARPPAPQCFVTEFMPVWRPHWETLKQHICVDINKDWLTTLLDYFWFDHQRHDRDIWFSEYELLGNWQLLQDPEITVLQQHRFEITDDIMRRITRGNGPGIGAEINCVGFKLKRQRPVAQQIKSFHNWIRNRT